MVVGNVYYVTCGYNESKFKVLLEKQLSKSSSHLPSPELVEQVISAYLACQDAGITDNALELCKMHLNSIQYLDKRSYCGNKVSGEPLEAVKAFNQLVMMRKLG